MEENNKLPRKEREKLQRKNEIIQVAINLFSQKGYNKTTLEEIATSAEFGIGTIYNYFQSKEEIYRNILESIFETSFDIFDEAVKKTSGVCDFFKYYTERVFNVFYENRNALLLFVSYMTSVEERPVNVSCESFKDMQEKITEILNERISKAINEGEIRPLNPGHLIQYYFSLVFPYITNLIKPVRENNLDFGALNLTEHIDFVIDVLFNGITLEKK
jgi:AcrR family transcriptional regulator